MKIVTFADLKVDGVATCQHCDKDFSKSARAEVYSAYVVVHCEKCRCMSVFSRTFSERAKAGAR